MLLNDWLAYLLFFAESERVNHILGNRWLLSCWLVWYGLMKESLLSLLIYLGNFYQKENLHSFTTPCVRPTKAICWPSWNKPYTYVSCCCIELFQTLWPYWHVFSYLLDQDHVHSTKWTSTLEVSYTIPSIHKINSMFNDPFLVSFKWGMDYLKKWHAQEAWPKKNRGTWRSHVENKIWTHEGPRKKIYIAMSSCYPHKRERDP